MKKMLSIIIAGVFGLEGAVFPVDGFGKSIWDRALLQRDSGFRRNDSATGFVEYTFEKNDFVRYGLSIPDKYGRVQGDVSEFGAEGKFVVLIKDTHCNYESDRNIVSILDILNRDYGIGLFGVEGADGLVDVSIFSGCPDSDRRKKVADDYLREGWLAPGEALALEKGKDCRFTMWGVEDKGLYLENFRCFREVYTNLGMVTDVFNAAGDVIGRLKERLYPEELIRFDTEVVKYRENKIGLVDFVKYLSGQDDKAFLKYPNIVLTLQASEIEETLDALQAEKERMELIGRLQKELPREDAQEVINISLHHKLGRVSPARYYNFLGQYVTDGYEEFERYRQLIELHSQIDSDRVFGEIDKLVEEIYDGNVLHEIDEVVRILRTLLRLGVSRDELARYKNEKYKITDIINKIVIMAGANGVAAPSLLKDDGLIAQIEEFFLEPERFYGYALERDKVIVSNLISRMNESGEHNAALVVGGFHLDAMRQLLKERGLKTAVIYPSITKYDNGAKERYLARMMDETFDPERILGEIGNVSLRPPLIGAGWSRGFINIVAQICLELGVDVLNLVEESGLSAFRDALEEVIRSKDEISGTVRQLLPDINREFQSRGLKIIEVAGPSNISWLIAPDEWRGETEFSYGLCSTTGSVNKIKAYLRRNGECVDVRGINMYVDKRLGQVLQRYRINAQMVLEYAITHACNVLGYDVSELPDNHIAIAVLDKSQHLAENHVGDGFVGINRYVIEEMLPVLADRFGVDAAMQVLGLILSHEFRHEISGKGKEMEEQLMMQDILIMDKIFGEQWEEKPVIFEYVLAGSMAGRHWVSKKRKEAKRPRGDNRDWVQTGQRQSQIVVKQERKEQSNGENHFFIGDAHGNLNGLIAELEGAGLVRVVDRTGLENQLGEFRSALLDNGGDLSNIEEALKYVEWTGGDAVLVQHGDLLDRMDKGIECLLLLVFLKLQTKKMGNGDVVLLLGNHELAYLGGPQIGDIHYFSYYGGYEMRVKELIRQLISMNFIQAMYLYGDIYCVHGGLSKRMEDELRRKIDSDDPNGITKDAVVSLSNEMLTEAAKSDNKNKYYQSLFMGEGIFWMRYTELKEDASPQIVAHVAHQQMGSIEPVKANAVNIEFGMWRENSRFGFLQGNPSGNAMLWNEYGNNKWKKSCLLDIDGAGRINWREIEEVSEEELDSGYKILFPNKIYCLPCSSRELKIINENNGVYNILMEDGNSCIIGIGDNAVAVERRQLEEITERVPAELAAAAVGFVPPDYILQDGQFVSKPDGCEFNRWESWTDVKSRLIEWTDWISPTELAAEQISFMYISTAIGYYWYGDILMENALLTENLHALFAVKLMHELAHRKIAKSSMEGLTGIRGEVIAVAVETQFFLAQDEGFRQAVIDNINSLIRYLETEKPGDKRVNILRADIEYLNRVQGMDLSTEGLIEEAINYLNNTQGNVVRVAKKRGLLDIREMSCILKRLQRAGTLTSSTPAYIGWLRAPRTYAGPMLFSDMRKGLITRKKRPVMLNDVSAINKYLRGWRNRKGCIKVKVGGIDIPVYLDGRLRAIKDSDGKEIQLNLQQILENAFQNAYEEAEETGFEVNIPERIHIAQIYRSYSFGEDHKGNEFIGINRYVYEEVLPILMKSYDQKTAEAFLTRIITHELVHEFTRKGSEVEGFLMRKDVDFMDRIFEEITNGDGEDRPIQCWEEHDCLGELLNIGSYERSNIYGIRSSRYGPLADTSIVQEIYKTIDKLQMSPIVKQSIISALGVFINNDWLIKEVLGGGVEGVTFVVRRPGEDNDVVLKILKPGIAGQQVVGKYRAFMGEFFTSRKREPGIVKVIDCGYVDAVSKRIRSVFDSDNLSLPQFVTNYLPQYEIQEYYGKLQRIRHGLPVSVQLRTMIQIARILQSLMGHDGVVHGDLHSSNVVLDEDLNVRVIDFGQAKSRSTLQGSIVYFYYGNSMYDITEVPKDKRIKRDKNGFAISCLKENKEGIETYRGCYVLIEEIPEGENGDVDIDIQRAAALMLYMLLGEWGLINMPQKEIEKRLVKKWRRRIRKSSPYIYTDSDSLAKGVIQLVYQLCWGRIDLEDFQTILELKLFAVIYGGMSRKDFMMTEAVVSGRDYERPEFPHLPATQEMAGRGLQGKKEEPIDSISWMKAPEGYRSDTEIIDTTSSRQTRPVTVELSVKGKTRRYGLTVDEQFYVCGVDVNKILQDAMNKAQVRAFEMGYSHLRYKDVMTVRALARSTYLAENHVWDGFIGVNRYVLDKIIPYIAKNYGQEKAEEFLGLVFSHEFTHEATGEGFGIETQLRIDDVSEMDRLFGVNWETNHQGLARILNVAAYEISLIRSLSEGKEVVKVVPGLTVIPSESEKFILELASFGANEGSICFNKHIEPNGRVEFEIYKETGDFIGALIPGQRMVIGPAGNHAWHKYLDGLDAQDYVFQVDSLEAVFIIEMEQNGAVNIRTEKVIEEEKAEASEWPADVDWLGVPDGSLYYGDILFVDSDGVVETGKPNLIAKIIKGEEENFVVDTGEKKVKVKVDIDPRIKESVPNIIAIMQDAFRGLFLRSALMGYPIQIPEEITLARMEKSHQYVEYLGDNVIGINVILFQKILAGLMMQYGDDIAEQYLCVLLEHQLIRLCTGWGEESEATIRNDDIRRLQTIMDAQKWKWAFRKGSILQQQKGYELEAGKELRIEHYIMDSVLRLGNISLAFRKYRISNAPESVPDRLVLTLADGNEAATVSLGHEVAIPIGPADGLPEQIYVVEFASDGALIVSAYEIPKVEAAQMLGTAAAHAGGTQYVLRNGEFEEPTEIKGTAYRHWVTVRNSIISSGWISPEDLAAMNIYFRNMTERAGYIEDGEIFLDKKLSGDDYPALFSLILMHEIAHKMLYTKLQMQGYYGEIFALWAETMLFLESENRNAYICQISKFITENSAEDKAKALLRYLSFLSQISAECSDRDSIDQKRVLQLVIKYFEENVLLYKGKDYRRGYNAAKTHNRLNPDMMLAVLNASMRRLATLKAPGTDLSERESQVAKSEAGKLPSVEGLENKTLQELDMEVSVGNADINLEDVFFTVKKTEEGRRYGFPKREGAVRPQDLIYVLAEKINGKLHIIVTDALWEDVLKNAPKMLASIIDHEWTEKVRGNHAEASRRMWDYIDDRGMNPFYEWYLNQLAECGEHAELKRLIRASGHTDKNGVRFKSYAAAALIVAQVEDITSHVIENREYLIEQIYQAVFCMQGRDITLRELIQKMQASTSINNAELVGIIFMVGEVLDPLFDGDSGEKSNAVVMAVLDEIVMGMQDVRFKTEDGKLFMALMDAVRANTAYAYNNIAGTPAGFVDNADVPAGVIMDFRHWITNIHEDGSFTFNPGMEAVLSRIKGAKNRIAVRVKDSDKQLAERIKAAVACGEQIILIDEKESEENTKEALINSGVNKANIAWIVTEIPEAGSNLDKMAKGTGIKLVHMEDKSVFHLTLLFAILYAKSSSVIGGNVPDDVQFLIRRFYALFGDGEQDIEEIIRDLGKTGIISVRFISIKDMLNGMRNMRFYLDKSA